MTISLHPGSATVKDAASFIKTYYYFHYSSE